MTEAISTGQDAQKQAAALRAVAEVEDGMVVGLGSGSTATFAIEALAVRVAAGLRIVGIPTSETTARTARRLGVPLTDFAAHRQVDLTIDGADEVESETLTLIKGRGGALLREKIVALASTRMIAIVDESKLVRRGGLQGPLPVEIVRFGWQTVSDRLAAMGYRPRLRLDRGKPFATDGGNYIVDCAIPPTADLAELDSALRSLVGVIATGIFFGLASAVVVGRARGVEILELRPR
jgi:ribose 5-phosphate isomerase A